MSVAPYRLACVLMASMLGVAAATSSAQPLGENASSSLTKHSALSSEIDRLVNGAIAVKAFPGASVAVVFNDGSLLSRSYGSTSIHQPTQVTNQTRFRIGSISKLVTALAILKLAEEQRLDIDAPVSSLFPFWPEVARLPSTVTVRRLMNHTSGLPDFTRAELEAMVDRGLATDGDLNVVLARPMRAEPGSEWAYADLPFRILSRVVERTSGQPYGDYITRTLAPALNTPSLRLCDPNPAGQASGYLSRNANLIPEPAYSIRGLLGEGGLCATAEDLARLQHEIVRSRWINGRSLAEMTAPTRLTGGELIDYGLGVRGGWIGSERSWGHTGGGLDGAWAAVAYFPARRLSIAVLANGTGSGIDAATLFGEIANAVVANASLKTHPVKDSLARSLRGTYRRRDMITCIVQTPTGLSRTRVGSSSPPTQLLHQGSAHFARSDFPLDRIVFQTKANKAAGYSVYYDGFFAEYWGRSSDDACRVP